MQWSYDEFGILTFSTELWNPEAAAGIVEPAKYQLGARSNDDELKMLRYNDEHLGGAGFIDWRPFDHPQLGKVEIGGWTHMYTVRNPPPRSLASTEAARQFLPDMLHSNCLFTLRHAMTAPLLRIGELEVEALGSGLYKLSALGGQPGFFAHAFDAAGAGAWHGWRSGSAAGRGRSGNHYGGGAAAHRSSGWPRRTHFDLVALAAAMERHGSAH